MKRELSPWGKDVSKKLIDLDMTKKDLAIKLDVNYSLLCTTITGYTDNVTMKKKVDEFLFSETNKNKL